MNVKHYNRNSAGFSNGRIAFLPVFVLLTLSACTSWIPVGSGGGHSEGITPKSGEFSLTYGNEISFNRNLSASVDAAFAQTRAGNPAVTATLIEFARPAHKLLAENYGIIFSYHLAGVRNQPESSHFWPGSVIFAADLKSTTENWQMDIESDFSNLVTDCDGCRLRMRIDHGLAELGFDSNRPRQLAVNARLNFLLEGSRDPIGSNVKWFDVKLSRKRVSQLADRLRNQLNRAYYSFLRSKGVKTSTGFRGIE